MAISSDDRVTLETERLTWWHSDQPGFTRDDTVQMTLGVALHVMARRSGSVTR